MEDGRVEVGARYVNVGVGTFSTCASVVTAAVVTVTRASASRSMTPSLISVAALSAASLTWKAWAAMANCAGARGW